MCQVSASESEAGVVVVVWQQELLEVSTGEHSIPTTAVLLEKKNIILLLIIMTENVKTV